MRLVKSLCFLLPVMLITYSCYAKSKSSAPKIDDKTKFLGVNQSDLKNQNTVENEKENNSSENALKDYGPITVCSDSASYDGDKNILIYSGNVLVMQVHNKHILCHEPKKLKKGSEYFVRDKNKSLKELQKLWLKKAQQICEDEKECNFISGQKLTMKMNEDKKIKSLNMSSEGLDASEFYTYPKDSNKDYAKSKKVTKGPLDGHGKQIEYNILKKDVSLYRKAIVNQNKNHYKGDKIIYDIDHDLVSIPGSRDRRSKIVLDGVQKETKIATGLPTLEELSKKDTSIASGSGIGSTNMNNNLNDTQTQQQI